MRLEVHVQTYIVIYNCDDLYRSQNLVENKSVLGSQELLTSAYGLIAVSMNTCTSSLLFINLTVVLSNYIGSVGEC